ncbi:unnamed protein product [Trichobilharzia szidati]|nr:unnamed protein product [Trichobilharzia szidati]
MEYKISKPHRLKRPDRCSTYNKYPLSSSVTGQTSSNAKSNTISSGDNNCNNNNSDNLTFNDCGSPAKKSSDQKTWNNPIDNDNELICYCWTNSVINTLDGCSSELNQILDTLNVSDVNNVTVNNDPNNNIDDISKCLMDDGLLMDIIADNDSFSSDPLNFDSSWPRSPSSSSVTNTTNNSCNFLDDFGWPTSTGLYLCLLQPINNYGSTLYPSAENTVTDSGVTNSKDIETVYSDKLPNSSISEPNEEEEKYDSTEKPDCLLPSTLCKSMDSNYSDESVLESSSLALSSPSSSTPSSVPTLSKQRSDCSQPKSTHCLTCLNFALKIETIEGNYQECFNVNEDSNLIGYYYLEFIHPDDLQQVINIFDNVTHTSSPKWISPYRISVPNENLNIPVEKSFQWIRSLVFYNKVNKVFVCFHRFLGLCESTTHAVSCNQRLFCKDFENLLAQYQLKTNNDNQTPQVEVSQPTCNTSNKYSANQPKNRQTRSTHPSIRPVRMKSSTTNKKSTNTMGNSRNNNNNMNTNSRPVKFFPIQSIRPIKQRLPQGCNQIVYANNPIKTIQFPLLHNSKNIRVPYSSYSNTNLYSSINSNNNNNNSANHFLINSENSMNSVLNISAMKSSLRPNLSTIPYFSRSVLPVVSYKPSLSSVSSPSSSSSSSSSPKRIVFLSSSSSPSITMSTVPGSVKKFQSLTTFRYKNRTNNKNDRYTDYRTIIPCTTITNNNKRFTYLQMNNSYNQKMLIPETNQSSNTFETNGKGMQHNGHCKPGDNLSVLTDNSSSSPSYSGYSHDSSTSNCVSPNDFSLTDFDVNMQMEATVSELLASVPSPCKSSFEEDKIMQIDSNSSLYDSDVIQYDESSFPPLTDSNLDGEDFTGFQSDFMNDSIILSN